MKVVKVNIYKHDMQLKAPWAIAGRVMESVENIFIELTTEEGLIGLGSGAPSPDVAGESVEDSHEKIKHFSKDLIGVHLDDASHVFDLLENNLKNFPAARSAIDMAIYDLLSKSEDKSLIDLLGRSIRTLPTSITIGVSSFEKTVADAKAHIDNGFSHLKIKIGENVDEDIEKVSALFDISPESVSIRVDANRGYSLKDLEKFYDRTHHLGLELIEQPLEVDKNKEMLNFSDDIRAICVADESLHSPADAVALVSNPKPFGVFNIKLMKCGGIHEALKIAKIAENEGIALMWGCMDESKISIAAALHAAFSSSATKYIDLDGFFDLGWDLVSGGYICNNGMMETNGKLGLGVFYNE
jgi:L-alanine-DL-glutamate epimerase-like enolase superfamily enzyme